MKKHVLIGPPRLARRYAQRCGWGEDTYLIVSRAHQLALLDPELIFSIVCINLDVLGRRITDEMRREIDRIRVLWPVPAVAAA